MTVWQNEPLNSYNSLLKFSKLEQVSIQLKWVGVTFLKRCLLSKEFQKLLYKYHSWNIPFLLLVLLQHLSNQLFLYNSSHRAFSCVYFSNAPRPILTCQTLLQLSWWFETLSYYRFDDIHPQKRTWHSCLITRLSVLTPCKRALPAALFTLMSITPHDLM